MFGRNAVATRRLGADGYRLHSIFYTLQGEGPFAGLPAIFVRLAGCNLKCHFCDTEFDNPTTNLRTGELLQLMLEASEQHRCQFFVFTGGEPMLQELGSLFMHERLSKMAFQIETAGSVWPRADLRLGAQVSMVCSPKTASVAPEIKVMADAGNPWLFFKYLISSTDKIDERSGIPITNTQREGKPAMLYHPLEMQKWRRRIYLQPLDENDDAKNAANAKRAAELCMQYGYKLSIQLHKIVGLD